MRYIKYVISNKTILSSGKIDEYEYLTDEKMLPSNHRKLKEQVKFIFFPLGKTFENKQKRLKSKKEQNKQMLLQINIKH